MSSGAVAGAGAMRFSYLPAIILRPVDLDQRERCMRRFGSGECAGSRQSGGWNGERESGGRQGPKRRRSLIEMLEQRVLLANQPDLLMTAAAAPAAAIEGNAEQISITWTVKNQGSAAAVGPWHDAVYLSPSGAIDSSSVRIDSLDESFQGPLAPGASYTVTRVADRSRHRRRARNFWSSRPTTTRRLTRAILRTTSTPLPITLSAAAVDLATTGATAPAAAVAGDGRTIAVSWTVKNQGAAAAGGRLTDAVYLGDSPTFDKLRQPVPRQPQRRRSSCRWPPAPATRSTDRSRSPTFRPEVTTCFSRQLRTGQGESDPAAGAMTSLAADHDHLAWRRRSGRDRRCGPAAAVAGNGQAIDVSYTVKNLGSVAARSSWTDSIYLSTQPTFDASAHPVSYYPGNSERALAAGASYTISQSISLPTSMTGSLYLLFRTDSFDAQSESTKADNVFAVPISVAAPNVDLLVTAAAAPAAAVVGDNRPIGLSYTVKNQGGDAASGSWRDAIYVSDQPTYDSTARLITSFYSGSSRFPARWRPARLYGQRVDLAARHGDRRPLLAGADQRRRRCGWRQARPMRRTTCSPSRSRSRRRRPI